MADTNETRDFSSLGYRYAPVDPSLVADVDPELSQALWDEAQRQQETIELIASENYVSPAVLAAQGSILTNKYAEGYPGKRYYGGCRCVDVAERLARKRAKELFGAEHANVQPHAGSQANAAAYMAVLDDGNKVLAMSLNHGGHLTHGHTVNFSGSQYRFSHYGVRKDTETIDYDALEKQAIAEQPKLILAGASAYPRIIEFARMREIADKVGALFMVDMAHIAGLVAAGVHPSPVPHAHIVTTTTHKTLRGPRGGMILSTEELGKKIDSAVFPGKQGGPLMHIIAAKAVAFKEAATPEFNAYQHRIIENAQALAAQLQSEGLRLVSGGTDNHLILVDVSVLGTTGRAAEKALEEAGLASNKNQIPFDTKKPYWSSGIRVGTPAGTTRGFGVDEFRAIGRMMGKVLHDVENKQVIAQVRAESLELCKAFPAPC